MYVCCYEIIDFIDMIINKIALSIKLSFNFVIFILNLFLREIVAWLIRIYKRPFFT